MPTPLAWKPAEGRRARGEREDLPLGNASIWPIVEVIKKGPHHASPHYLRGFVTKPPRRQARRPLGAARRGNSPPGNSEGGVPPSGGFYKGLAPL